MNGKISAYDIAAIAVMSALLEAVKVALNAIPNVELVSFLLIVFTLYFGIRKTLIASWIFTAIEIMTWGLRLWVVFYIYTWPVLIICVYLFRKHDNALLFAVISGVFGLCFGALSSIVYILMGDPAMAFSWWLSGLSFDAVHGASNFCIALVLYRPAMSALKRVPRTKVMHKEEKGDRDVREQ